MGCGMPPGNGTGTGKGGTPGNMGGGPGNG